MIRYLAWISLLLFVFLAFASMAGASERGQNVLSETIRHYYPNKTFQVSDAGNNQYSISGPGGTKSLTLLPATVERLDAMNKNPASNDSLSKICGRQAGAIRTAMEAPLRPAEAKPACKGSKCWTKSLCGNYRTLQPHNGVRVVVQSNCNLWPENLVCFKTEFQNASLPDWPFGTGWGPTVVVRNPSGENPLALIDAADGTGYVKSVTKLKAGQKGSVGDSCYEVCVSRNGQIYKDESPNQHPFGR